MKVLYVSYDGVLEPLGQSQVLRYLERLSTQHELYLITFEKASDRKPLSIVRTLKERLSGIGIRWIPLHYHKNPSAPATLFDLLQGVLVGAWLTIRFRIQIVHARSYVPSVIALVLKKLFSLKFIFDMRGFWADERVDVGLWPVDGRLYLVAKWFEKQFLLSSDCVVSLTHAAVAELNRLPYLRDRTPRYEVITTCTDLELFRPIESSSGSRHDERLFTVGYVGSIGVWYLFDEVLKWFAELLRRMPGARLHILNRGDHAFINGRLSLHAIPRESVKIAAADHAGVAKAMRDMDVGVFFIKPVYSKLASAPTELGEFLGCGVPCLGNAGVGDMAGILEREAVGAALRDFTPDEMQRGMERIIDLSRQPDIKRRCREAAIRHFSLEDGVRAYDRVYRELIATA